MLVFKFGGASVKDSHAVKNVAAILKRYEGQKIIVVISAMGKTTNLLETIVDALWHKDQVKFFAQIENCLAFHLTILNELIPNNDAPIHAEINAIFNDLATKFSKPVSANYDFEYDQIVSLGELVSTKIVNAYLQSISIDSKWLDIRSVIRTNHLYRDASVDWELTMSLSNSVILPLFNSTDFLITQGFLGNTAENFTTTLGREGSDYSAGILAFCTDAENVTIWKDVPGMLNADPKYFENTVKLDQISFKEAIELSYYGASIIHPKTIKPLQNKGIPLLVKSFQDPEAEGTIIQHDTDRDALIPSYIFKKNQVLFSIMPKDFSFIVEENLSHIFDVLAKQHIKLNLMQNSALSFSFIVDAEKVDISNLINLFKEKYEVKFNEGLELITIRHYNNETIEKTIRGRRILIEQRDRQTVRLVVG